MSELLSTPLLQQSFHNDLNDLEKEFRLFNGKCEEIGVHLKNISTLPNITSMMLNFSKLRDNIKTINNMVCKVDNFSTKNNNSNIADKELIKDIVIKSKNANRKFEDISSIFMRIVETTQSRYELEINVKEGDQEEIKLRKNKFYKQKIKYEVNKSEEISKEMDSIKKITTQMKELTLTMLNELNTQGKKLSFIEDHLGDTHNNLKKSNFELTKLENSSNSGNRLYLWICILFSIMFLIGLLIFAYYWKSLKIENSNINKRDVSINRNLNETETIKLFLSKYNQAFNYNENTPKHSKHMDKKRLDGVNK